MQKGLMFVFLKKNYIVETITLFTHKSHLLQQSKIHSTKGLENKLVLKLVKIQNKKDLNI